MDINNYFDLRHILVYELSGSEWIFIFLSIILVIYVCLKLRLQLPATGIITSLWISVCVAGMYASFSFLWNIILLAAASFFFMQLKQKLVGGN